MHAQWLGHLCGLCLALRDRAGQSARVLTGYDVLLVSILTEAQTGRLATTKAGACPLRGFRTAEVVAAATPAMQAGSAAALLAGSAGLIDKVNDGDAPVWLRPIASRSARHLAAVGASTAEECGFDGTDLWLAPAKAKSVEGRKDANLDELLEPAGTAVAAMFAHTAVAAGRPANAVPLRRAGQAFGRLVHLVDAVEDRQSDRQHGKFNPLDATATSDIEAGELARLLHSEILASLEEADFVDGALAVALLGPTLRSAINRLWGVPSACEPSRLPRRRGGGVVVGVAAALAARASIWGGGRRNRPWRNDPYAGDPYGDPYGGPRYGGGPFGGRYRRGGGCGGPSCGELLACDCCANCCCNECCGDDCCCCVV